MTDLIFCTDCETNVNELAWNDHCREVHDVEPLGCDLRHEPPYDFAWCETHDETFPLGQTCRWRVRELQAQDVDMSWFQQGLQVQALVGDEDCTAVWTGELISEYDGHWAIAGWGMIHNRGDRCSLLSVELLPSE
jgi:hypothetical protein